VTVCLLKNEPTSLFYVAYISSVRSVCEVKARVNSPYLIYWKKVLAWTYFQYLRRSHGQDPKPGDLTMARLNPVEIREEDRTH
jgi:hypothetical protein